MDGGSEFRRISALTMFSRTKASTFDAAKSRRADEDELTYALADANEATS
jgi:hypothetical protein